LGVEVQEMPRPGPRIAAACKGIAAAPTCIFGMRTGNQGPCQGLAGVNVKIGLFAMRTLGTRAEHRLKASEILALRYKKCRGPAPGLQRQARAWQRQGWQGRGGDHREPTQAPASPRCWALDYSGKPDRAPKNKIN